MHFSPTMLLVAAGFVIPNALFAGALAAGLAGEPRSLALCCYALIVVLPLPLWTRLALFPVVFFLDAAAVISGLFGLGVLRMLFNLGYIVEIEAHADPLFLTLAVLFLATLLAGILVIRRGHAAFGRGNRGLLLALTLSFLAYDVFAYTAPDGSGSRLLMTKPDYDSGVDRSDFHAVLNDPQRPHVLFIVVEALGHFVDPAKSDMVFAGLRQPEILRRYDLSKGTTRFWESTTAAEMRELCATQQDFTAVGPGNDPTCLPDLFRSAGYDTLALHGFKENFFGRHHWYPYVGFEKTVFLDDLRKNLGRSCGKVWRGICDTDLGGQITRMFATFERPTFLYWLTLNTHAPVNLEDGTGELGCNTSRARIADAEVCVMAELWKSVIDTAAAIARTHSNLEVFIVGDHRPPLIRRAARAQFADDVVPWLRLSPKRDRARTLAGRDGGEKPAKAFR